MLKFINSTNFYLSESMSTITLEELKEKEARWTKITEFWREKYSHLEEKLTEKLSVA